MKAGNRNKIFSNSNQLSAPGPPSDPVVPMLLDAADKVGVKVIKNLNIFSFKWLEFLGRFLLSTLLLSFLFQVCLHIEPFANRTVESVRNAVLYANQRYVGVTCYKI